MRIPIHGDPCEDVQINGWGGVVQEPVKHWIARASTRSHWQSDIFAELGHWQCQKQACASECSQWGLICTCSITANSSRAVSLLTS